ncbi:MAG: aspartate aminotransferase family protein [Acidimicrobiaceae bacterium]|nr:aspartate aminotransferase family protein [Acidimicrobiaceae bacterium]
MVRATNSLQTADSGGPSRDLAQVVFDRACLARAAPTAAFPLQAKVNALSWVFRRSVRLSICLSVSVPAGEKLPGMTAKPGDYESALARADCHARDWLNLLRERPIAPRASADDLLGTFGGPLPEGGLSAADVIDELAEGAEPGLLGSQSGRFFGWVMGGTLPAALGADWLVSAWDQNAGLRFATPAVVAVEEAASCWLLELLGLPSSADVGFVTGATMANFSGLAAARFAALERVGWDVNAEGLAGAPAIHVLVGAERHDTVDLALRYLGLGRPTPIAADDEGRIDLAALGRELETIPVGEPIIVCLQAGNLHSGAFDPFDQAIELAHQRGAWVHVDGAFGLWAAACPSLRHLVTGLDRADSWATDAHKTLNVPYDCGIAIVAERSALRSVFGVHPDYLIADRNPGPGDPHDKVPELSRRARGVPTWAALRSLGRRGVVELVETMAERARSLARQVAEINGAEILNDVVYTQVCVAFGDDDRTRAVIDSVLSSGTTWMSGSRWHGRAVLRISVSNWSTDEGDVEASVEALRRAAQV